jgi:Family of unknown function (DUF5767)
MSKHHKKLGVKLVPLDAPTEYRTHDFGMEGNRLFLEKVENKNRIKKEFQNVETIIDGGGEHTSLPSPVSPPKETAGDGTFHISLPHEKSAPHEHHHEHQRSTREHDHHHSRHSRHHSSARHHHTHKSEHHGHPRHFGYDITSLLNDGTQHHRSAPTNIAHDKYIPPLSEIETGMKNGRLHVSSYNDGNIEELEEKRELLRKIDNLRRRYRSVIGTEPSIDIPTFTEHTDLRTLRLELRGLEKHLHTTTDAENYRKYLIIGFKLMEIFIIKFLVIDANGLASSQQSNMSQYEELLVELSEKHYIDPEKRFPVELRLAFVVLVNTVFFVLTKQFMSNLSNIGSMFGEVLNSAPPFVQTNPQNSPNPQNPRPKMQGPSQIDIQEILGENSGTTSLNDEKEIKEAKDEKDQPLLRQRKKDKNA